MKHCDSNDIRTALDFIRDDRLLNFYMYMDIEECGVDDEELDMWFFEEEGKLTAIGYLYYDCLHIYSKGTYCSDELMDLIREINPKVMISSMENIDEIKKRVNEDDYIYESNHMVSSDKFFEENHDFNITPAEEKDIPEIAALMMKADIYSDIYTYDKLVSDMTRRLHDGFGRMFIIRDDDGKLIATNATNAETGELAVIGGLVTDPDARGRGLGTAITASTWNLVMREGKIPLSFLITTNHQTISVHKKVGCKFIGINARLILKD